MAFEKGIKRNFALREHTCTAVKDRWNLGAQAAQHVIKRTCDACITLKANRRRALVATRGAVNRPRPTPEHRAWDRTQTQHHSQ
ncbi:hypothetical protein ABZT43_21700 [Streptomyces sp. NPDC005349]|uniref:hypothetical protein n=1 Tax=Streptomyces sp. NPDC005349 TaxID=3157037 RepID=UPI0033B326FD